TRKRCSDRSEDHRVPDGVVAVMGENGIIERANGNWPDQVSDEVYYKKKERCCRRPHVGLRNIQAGSKDRTHLHHAEEADETQSGHPVPVRSAKKDGHLHGADRPASRGREPHAPALILTAETVGEISTEQSSGERHWLPYEALQLPHLRRVQIVDTHQER